MIHKKNMVVWTSMLTLLIMASFAHAGRADRSRVNQTKAQNWCANYTRTHSGAECRVKKMPALCPRGFRRGARFKRVRSRGYKSCIRGSKRQVFKSIRRNITRPIASRVERSKENRRYARQWCNRYLRTRPSARCTVIAAVRSCPAGLRVGQKYKRIHSRGYKTCIR